MKPQFEAKPGARTKYRTEAIPASARRATLSLLVFAWIASACAKSPQGLAFEPAPPPPEHRGRVYVYREDERDSLASVRITIDGREIGRFRNHEYQTFELPAGPRHLRAGLRGFGLLAWGWNDHRFRLKPGKTVYFKISVRLTARPAPTTPGLEIGGLPSGGASENVFIIPQSATAALSDLEITTRLARPGGR